MGAEHKKNVEHLIVTKAQRTHDAGTPLSSFSLKNEIDYVEKVLTMTSLSFEVEERTCVVPSFNSHLSA